MSSVQLKFSLRTSPNVKTVHLVGSWDNYARKAPLSASSSKPGAWTGKFRFPASVLKLGGRYWYYYIMDGYQVSHDPSAPYTVEPTTNRKLNILDVPTGKATTDSSSTRQSSGRYADDVVTGRGVSPSRIHHPKPNRPYPLRQLESSDLSVDELTRRFGDSGFLSSDDESACSSAPSLGASSRSSGSTSPSSVSSLSSGSSSPVCCCERYGITRKGDRVKLDCRGSRCGYGSERGSTASSSEDGSCYDSDSDEDYRLARRGLRRQGIVVRR